MTGVKGIGIRYATKLVAAGVTSVEDLAHFEPHDLSQKLEISERRAARWIQDAHHALPTT
jgi:predicted flap endonuclease-1-like 5' DNA nuclease